MSTAAQPSAATLQRTLTALRDMRARLDASERARTEPIAVVGLACRFPGGANSAEAFWQLLCDGVDAISEVPADRWDTGSLYDPDPTAPGRVASRWGGFLDQVDRFDAAFFGISPREADQMDPQQRIMLEVAWEALEHAGQTAEKLAGSATGVFVGVHSHSNDYTWLQFTDPEQIDTYTGTGTSHSVIAGRISYLLDLRGPSIALDTACSSSLVAVHMAAQSLRAGECQTALVGGVNLALGPHFTMATTKMQMMAADGRCKTFDAAADGFVRGEGCGAVVLKRLCDARRDGDPILAVIRGSAVNQDGRTNGLTAPSGLSQQAIIQQALRNAKVDPAAVSAVEAHGTGTALGDPIEIEALTEVFGAAGPDRRPIMLSSVKTNIGHLEAAAGIAGLIKVVLSLRHETIPAHLHFQTLNPNASLAGSRLVIPTRSCPWPRSEQPRIATVSSFGWSGTNGCLVLEEAPTTEAVRATDGDGEAELLPISARSPQALRALAMAYQSMLSTTEASLRELCWTASMRRSHHPFRASVTGSTKTELASRLAAFAAEPFSADAATPDAPSGPIFVFSGQGTQWAGMGRDLAAREPVFAESMRHCDDLFRAYADWSLLEEIGAAAQQSRLDRTELAQPAIFAVQVSLAELWRSWGITPQAVVGHSVGEIAAAHIAGILSLEDAVRVAYHRGRVMQQAHGQGRMASVALPSHEAEQAISAYGSRLAVAAINSPTATVLSGEPDALADVLAALAERDVFAQGLRIEYAFHSSQMAPFQTPLIEALQGISPRPATVPIVSTVTGLLATGQDFGPGYWARNIREPVQFAATLARVVADGDAPTVIEIGPQPALIRPITEQFEQSGRIAVVLASMRSGAPARATLLSALGGLYTAGHRIDWSHLYPHASRYAPLPAYPWQRQRHWVRTAPRPNGKQPRPLAGGHPLLGRRARTAMPVFDSVLDAGTSFLGDHRIHGAALLPMTAYLELALAAHGGESPVAVTDLVLHEALVLPDDAPRAVQVVLTPGESGQTVQVFSQPADGGDDQTWTRHAIAVVRDQPPASGASGDLATLRARLAPADVTLFYQRLLSAGIEYGPAFTGLRALWRGSGEALGHAVCDAGGAAYRWHPALLDAALQVALAALPGDLADAWLPISLDRFVPITSPGAEVWSHARLRSSDRTDSGSAVFDVELWTAEGVPAARVEGLLLRRASRYDIRRNIDPGLCHGIVWEPALLSESTPSGSGDWLLLGDRGGTGAALAQQLCARGERAELLSADVDDEELAAQVAFGRAWRGIVDLGSLDAPAGEPTLDEITTAHERRIGRVLGLVSTLSNGGGVPTRLWLITRGARAVSPSDTVAVTQAPAWGLARAANREVTQLPCVGVDLDADDSRLVAPELVDVLLAPGADDEYALRDGGVLVPRLVPVQPRVTKPARLRIRERGVLENLTLDNAARRDPGPDEVEIRVRATGLNFRDVLNALDMYPGEAGPLGLECAGEVVAAGARVAGLAVGDRVLALAPASFATYVTVRSDLVAPIPAALNWAEAATVPVAYGTAAYALRHLTRIKPGDRVLIHAAAGGVGQAAVRLALAAGAEVFATASPGKWAALTDLGVRHVFHSRTLGFADGIRERTGGAGVDIVLNSLTDDFIAHSIGVLRDGGVFLEIGKRGIWTAEQVAALRPDVAYHTIDLGAVIDADPALVQSTLRRLAGELADGSLAPLPLRAFPLERAEDAFRHMAQARHIGKVVLTQEPPLGVRPDATYLITGGLGAVGQALARWLAGQGARHLVLLGRSASSVRMRDLPPDTQVHVRQVDVTDADALQQVLTDLADTLPPVRGIIHAAGVLDDGILAKQDQDRIARVLAPKVAGGWHLHRLTRAMPLDFFVLCSSTASLLGSAGQAGYVTANTFLDALAHHRRSTGLVATSVNWGPWAAAGMAAQLSEQQRQRLAAQGYRPMTANEATEALGSLLGSGLAQAGVFAMDWPTHLRQYGDERPLLARMRATTAVHGPAAPARVGEARERIARAHPTERRQLVQEHVQRTAVAILGLPPAQPINPQQSLRELGLDSLMAVELRNALGQFTAGPLPSTLAFDHPTVAKLTDRLLRELFPEPEAPAPPGPAAPRTPLSDDLVARVAALDDADVEALLAAKLSALDGRSADE